ncbi:Sugar or nucleoside kinase, ribokinase family [Candidatus Pantoea floridensis]|uniref:Sugar or nucleoside kinase, ribokinase family n=2 Tax=Candidatus Pantoea floridensis TaxID=1938870 RepID=A0A286DP72_9GAMM|nr:sugar/nucleoside kinase (ribokinase family) [Enterobacteriaceae bacterium JKS000233]SOD60488.1 Sugar or nucleoside kinase, ribokinase family [Pantoea floridensis]
MMEHKLTATLYVVGNINVDLIMGTLDSWPQRGTEVMLNHSELRPGGSAGNCALALEAMQVRHRAVANQGDDGLSAWLASHFPHSAAHWTRYSCETSLTVGVTHSDHERSFLSNLGHIVKLSAQDVLAQLPAEAADGDIVLLCGTFLCLRLYDEYPALLSELRQRGFITAVDTGWPPQGWSDEVRQQVMQWLPLCDWLLLNEVETLGLGAANNLPASAQTLVQQLSGRGGCVVKCGPQGAHCWQAERSISQPARPVTVVDTIGAGDSFNAGFLTALVHQQDLATALQWGIAVASLAISTLPRRYPDWHQLQLSQEC